MLHAVEVSVVLHGTLKFHNHSRLSNHLRTSLSRNSNTAS